MKAGKSEIEIKQKQVFQLLNKQKRRQLYHAIYYHAIYARIIGSTSAVNYSSESGSALMAEYIPRGTNCTYGLVATELVAKHSKS